MKESKAYKTYLGYSTGTVPPKVARKFKKASPSKKDGVPVPADEEPVQKGKRVKRSAKKSSTTPTTGIDLLSEVTLTEEAQVKEVRKKSLRDFHRSHLSGSGSVAKKPPSVEKITLPVTNEGTGDKPGVPDVTKDDSTESESKSWGNDDDDSNNEEGTEQENDNNDDNDDDDDDDDDEFKDDDKDDDNDDDQSEGDEDRGMDSDDVPDKKKTEVPVTSSSRSSGLASKFLIFLDIPPADTEIISLLDVHVHHESTPSPLPTETTNIPPLIPDFASVFRFNDRVITLEKDVAELKNDNLHTQVIALVDDHLDTRMGATREEFMNFLSASFTNRITEQVIAEMTRIKMKALPLDRGLKKRKTSKDAETTTRPTFRLLKGTHLNNAELEYDFKECYKALSEKLDWENPKGGDYPFDLSKPLSLITCGNCQSVPAEFFINNDLKADNKLYKFKEGDFPQLRINDIEDMLLLVVRNRLTNLLGDDVADFAIALRMFTKSLVIQKRVEDLQLGVESYQKHINVTKPDTTRPDLRKRHLDGTLTRLLSLLEDITRSIKIEYLPKRRWSTLEKKRAYYMTKEINKLLKERRMMRSLEKFVGSRLYGTDLGLLQRTI
nr:hypothetical protein [Tanacetum cinerariifolium]